MTVDELHVFRHTMVRVTVTSGLVFEGVLRTDILNENTLFVFLNNDHRGISLPLDDIETVVPIDRRDHGMSA